jgi:Cft2 family RNA processing exonuclease
MVKARGYHASGPCRSLRFERALFKGRPQLRVCDHEMVRRASTANQSMRIIPLGGAGEVGASSAIIEVAGATLLVDAGVRVSASAKGPLLPAYELLEKTPDACIITHAHMDHTGSLPVAAERIGDALIHMTIPTLHLLEVLQGDAARLAASDDSFTEDDGRVRFDADQLERMIARIEPHAFHEPFCPVPGRPDIICEFAPCGHILGAAMLAIETPEEHILWTGDYSTSRMPQPTIGGLDVDWVRARAARRPFDLIVTEATYGTSKHQPRERETARFISRLEKTAAKGGKTLIPAFAVGRAQDILFILRQAKLAGRLKGVPVYADGMVRPICNIYENLAHEMYPGIEEPLTLLDPELDIFKANSQSRAKLCSVSHEGPAVVISSSGMLVGGRSVEYFRAFAGDKRNTVLLSGYQDAEAVGGALLRLRRGGNIRLGSEEVVRVKCTIDRYRISAHADGEQIAEVVEASGARKVGLVHADAPALTALREKLGKRRTVVLENGKALHLKGRPSRALMALRAAAPPPAPAPEPVGPSPSEGAVRALWERLVRESPRDYSEAEIARMFLGRNYPPGHRELLSECLMSHRLYFMSGSRTAQKSYRPRPEDELVDMLIERGRAYQVPLEIGDVVIFCDGSSEQHVAIVTEVGKNDASALVPMAPRRTTFRREWVRLKTGISLRREVERGDAVAAAIWLRAQLREARALPTSSAIEGYFRLRGQGVDRVGPEYAARAILNGQADRASSAMILAAALATANARALFTLDSDGSLLLRDEAFASARWKAFSRVAYVRGLSTGEEVRISNGELVVPTGDFHADSFDYHAADGTRARCNYRRVLLPGEGVVVAEASPTVLRDDAGMADAKAPRKRRRRRKPAQASAPAPRDKRRRRRRRHPTDQPQDPGAAAKPRRRPAQPFSSAQA